MSVIHNTQQPELNLRNKSKSIFYKAVRESVIMGETNAAHISTHDHGSDLLTKVLYGAKRKKFARKIVYDIYD